MSLIVIGETLNVYNDIIDIQFFNTSSLSYSEITKINGIDRYFLSADSKTLYVQPNTLEGNFDCEANTVDGTVFFTLYYGTEYEKSNKLGSEAEDFYPEGMFKWNHTNPKYDETRTVNDLFSKLYPTGDKIPITKKFDNTFPEYISSQLLGIGMSYAVQQYELQGDGFSWVLVSCDIKQPINKISDFKKKGIANNFFTTDTSAPARCGDSGLAYSSLYFNSNAIKRKIKNITDIGSGRSIKLKYGAVFDKFEEGKVYVDYCGYNKAIELWPVHANYFCPDAEFITQYGDVGRGYSSIHEGDFSQGELQNWRETQGVPACCEILYYQEPYDITQLTEEFIMPAYSRVNIVDYDPINWLNTHIENREIIVVTFNGTDFKFRVAPPAAYYKHDTTQIQHLIDHSKWYSSIK